MPARYRAVVFDLLTALLDSWSLWNDAARDPERGLQWRLRYLELVYRTGRYRPYEDLVREAAIAAGLDPSAAASMIERWDELKPWPEAPHVLAQLSGRVPLGVLTNCSAALGRRAAKLVGVEFAAVVTAEEVGWYKPDLRTYRAVLQALGTPAAATLFVAGSPGDVKGAAAAGMPVVWHDRWRLRQERPAQEAMLVLDSLDQLPQLVSGIW
ncbi:MAG: haloacid dehalogenase [Gemmatimonadales bacterium]|nr:MAG: haloacid dehalogenase [Gemmatimonadales bacterium]